MVLSWLTAQDYSISTSSASSAATSAIAMNERLLPAARNRIEEIVVKRHLKVGDVMAEMGFSKLNAPLGRALNRREGLQPDVIVSLQKWLAANALI